jgi:hypothetical protein
MSWNFFPEALPKKREGSPGILIPTPDAKAREFEPMDIICGSGSDAQRNIFGIKFSDSSMKYSEFEFEKLDELESTWGAEGDPLRGTGIEETQKMRFLQGCGWDVVRAASAIRNYVAWRSSTGPWSNLAPNRLDDETWLYFYGRDKCFRPVLYIDCFRLLQVKGTSTNLDSVQDTLLNTMNFFVNNLSVPGHIEQVVVIADLDGCTAWSTPIEDMEKCAITLTSRFRGRLNKLFIVNTPIVFYAFWSIVRVFIPQRTLSKISILRFDFIQDILAVIDEDQLDPILRSPVLKSG